MQQAQRIRARIFLFAGVLDIVLGAGFLLWGHSLFPPDAAPVLGMRLEQLIGICLLAAALVPLAIYVHGTRNLEQPQRRSGREPSDTR